MTHQDAESRIRAFFGRHFKHLELRDDEDIFALGLANSLFALQIVMFVEKEFQLALDDDDVTLDNFRTLSAVTDLVHRKTL
jgi:methoxymalonate biosynthesis acyl carrier protein